MLYASLRRPTRYTRYLWLHYAVVRCNTLSQAALNSPTQPSFHAAQNLKKIAIFGKIRYQNRSQVHAPFFVTALYKCIKNAKNERPQGDLKMGTRVWSRFSKNFGKFLPQTRLVYRYESGHLRAQSSRAQAEPNSAQGEANSNQARAKPHVPEPNLHEAESSRA